MLWKAVPILSLFLSVCSFNLSFAAESPQHAPVYRIGWLSLAAGPPTGAGTTFLDAFKRELRRLGYVEGQNIEFIVRWADANTDRLPGLAAELAALKPDVIVSLSTPAVRAAKQATATIPIVMLQVCDAVGSGLVASLARPGGNVTGVSDVCADMAVKSVELVHILVPKATRIAVLMTDSPRHAGLLKAIQDAAAPVGSTVLPLMEKSTEELEQAFAMMANKNTEALIVLGGYPQGDQAEKIAELALKAKLPTIYPDRWFPERGGLLSLGANTDELLRSAAPVVDKILKGAKPADLPVQQPTRILLVINLKAAKALGLTIPQSLLLRADEVIQ